MYNIKLMKTLYRILSYFLIIIAAILGFACLFALLIALNNPALLLSVFLIAAVVMYSFTSFIFLVKGIDSNRPLKSNMKDLIKVNAYVALVFMIMNIVQSVSIISNPVILNDAVSQVTAMQNGKSPLSAAFMLKMMKAVVWFMLFYSVILGMHISITFRLLKQYAHLFPGKNSGDINSASNN